MHRWQTDRWFCSSSFLFPLQRSFSASKGNPDRWWGRKMKGEEEEDEEDDEEGFPVQWGQYPAMQHYGRVRRADSGRRSLCCFFFVVCVCLSVLHNEWSAARMFRTLAVPVLSPLLLQVDIAGGGVVGEGLQNRPVAPKVHHTWRGGRQREEREREGSSCNIYHPEEIFSPE